MIRRLRQTLRDALRFRRLRTRLSVLYAGLFALALIVVSIVAHGLIRAHAEDAVRAELAATATVNDRIWALRVKSLGDSADVLARDFGFREAVASGDAATIGSALANLRERADVPSAYLVDTEGGIIGSGDVPPSLRPVISELPYALPEGRREAVIATGAHTLRLVVTPVLAPQEIGWVVFAIPLADTEMRALERLSAIPIHAAILRRDAAGSWNAGDGSAPPSPTLQAFAAASLRGNGSHPATLDLPGGAMFAVARPLPGRGDVPEALLLLTYPLDQALASYAPVQRGIWLAGAIGLLLVLLGSQRLARDIARPIASLARAAHALREGSRAEVPVETRDELGRLAESFNEMSAGIIERENRISHLAFHDSLTGLPNRVFFREQLDNALARAPRMGEKVTVLCLDLDGFKGVNDTLGHPVGDGLLEQIGQLLTDIVTDGTVSRLGGDEFAIILADRGDADRPRALAQDLVDRFREPFRVDGHQIATGVSIGIAIGPEDGSDADQLLKNADLALYRAKQDGRGCFRFFEASLDAAARKRRQLELDLRDALKHGQFRLNYQPIFDLKNDRIGGFESLLRWEHPIRGNISPVEFIPVAEDTGLIVAIGEWVMHEACRQATEWPEHVRVAVNVSPLQFRNSGFANIIFQALSQSGLAPNRLEVEITESVFLDGETNVIGLLHKLRGMGVRIALDDFGTGYSSLSYLRSFPFDKIKIDKSFVNNVAEDRGAAAIVQAIVDLAKALSMETTAEGVEHAEQLAELSGQGCSSIQGYLFSKPVTGADVPGLLAAGLTARRAA